MKALCLVAHPDDCIIFAYSYIHHHPEHDWTIGYLTYTEQDTRGAEIAEFWRRRNIPCVFLGFEDHWHDQEQQTFTRWQESDAVTELKKLAAPYDLVLTHDQNGDYGHIHHRLVHQSVCDHPCLVTFAPVGAGNATYSLQPGTYSFDELPTHAHIIAGFHTQEHRNSYKDPQCI